MGSLVAYAGPVRRYGPDAVQGASERHAWYVTCRFPWCAHCTRCVHLRLVGSTHLRSLVPDRRSFLTGLLATSGAALAGCAGGAASSGPLPAVMTDSTLGSRLQDESKTRGTLTLRGAAHRNGRFFGCATSSVLLAQDAAFAAAVGTQCGVITPEYQLKWNAIEYSPHSFNYKPVDDILAFAKTHRQKLRGHTLMWEQSTPQWAKTAMLAKTGGDWSVVTNYFTAVLGRYAAEISQWDVVNEFIDTQSGDDGLRTTTFYQAFGPGYIERAFRQARALAPSAHLMLNDYSLEYENDVDEARRVQMIATLTALKAAGAPIDGVGIQAHLDLSKGPLPIARLARFYADIAALGLEITITELDVREADTTQPIAARDAAVATHVTTFLGVALAQPAVVGVVTWGLTDKYSWLNAPGLSGAGLNRGLPSDYLLATKPMYASVDVAFASTPRSSGGMLMT